MDLIVLVIVMVMVMVCFFVVKVMVGVEDVECCM